MIRIDFARQRCLDLDAPVAHGHVETFAGQVDFGRAVGAVKQTTVQFEVFKIGVKFLRQFQHGHHLILTNVGPL